MKLLFIFLVFFFFALAQEIGARPHPDDSSSWFSSWFTPSSSDYDRNSLPNSPALSGISVERADLLIQGTALASQVLDLVKIVPGLESVSHYGKMGVNMAENLTKNAMEAVNTYQKNVLQNLLDSQFPMIANARETIKSGIKAVLTILEQAIEGIQNLSSVGDNILSSLDLTRSQLASVHNTFNYL